MKAFGLLVVYSLIGSLPLEAEPPHIRPLDSISVSTIESGVHLSQTFRTLVAELEQSDLIVHVVGRHDLPALVAGMTRFVADRGGSRYLRVEIATWLAPKARVSVLAHEFQHAREIARSGARSNSAVVAFYQESGKPAPTLRDGWETAAAEATERRVWVELGARGSAHRAVE